MDQIIRRPSFPAPDKRRRPPGPAAKMLDLPAAAEKAADSTIVRVLSAVDPNRLAKDVIALADFRTRHSLSPNNLEAANWLRDSFWRLATTA